MYAPGDPTHGGTVDRTAVRRACLILIRRIEIDAIERRASEIAAKVASGRAQLSHNTDTAACTNSDSPQEQEL